MTETEPLPTSAECEVCAQTIAVDNGILRQHAGINDWLGVSCPGSGTMIYEPVPNPVEEVPPDE